MAVYVVLQFDNDQQAKTLVGDMLDNPESDILTPVQENNVKATVRAVFKKPTLFCECPGGRKTGEGGSTRGRKYGWWVHAACGKPKKFWANGNQWYAFGTNLLPLALLEKMGLPTEERPAGWKSDQSWTFLLEDTDHDWDYKMEGSQRVRWCYDHNQLLETCRVGVQR